MDEGCCNARFASGSFVGLTSRGGSVFMAACNQEPFSGAGDDETDMTDSDCEDALEVNEDALFRRLSSFLAETGQYLAVCPVCLQYLQTVFKIRGQVMGLLGLGFIRVQ